MNITADDMQDAMVSKSQQLCNDKTGLSQTAGIAAKLRLFLWALQELDEELRRNTPAGKIKLATYSTTGGNCREMISVDDATAECPIVDSDAMKAFRNDPNKRTLTDARRFLQASVVTVPSEVYKWV